MQRHRGVRQMLAQTTRAYDELPIRSKPGQVTPRDRINFGLVLERSSEQGLYILMSYRGGKG